MEPRSHVVVTSIGTDRPGIVADLSGWILAHDGNIEASRMSQLGGEFATIILVSGDEGLAARLEQSRAGFESAHHLAVATKPVTGAPQPPGEPLLRYSLRATSLDHPGIVNQVAALLRQHSINIVSASTRTTPAPFTGAPIFQFQMEVDIPGTMPLTRFREALRVLGDRENIDLMLAPLPDA